MPLWQGVDELANLACWVFANTEAEHDTECTYSCNVILSRIRAATVPVENHSVLHILRVFIALDGTRGGAVFGALRYKPEGRGFDSRWFHWNFSLT
jgi:hypothetical protein